MDMSVGADERARFRGLPDRQIAILTGVQGTGKTTTCRGLLERGHELGLDVAGIFCPARFDAGEKVGIDLVDARTGELRPLAEIDEAPGGVRLGPYRFDAGVLAWGAARLAMACPCDILFVDEIGPLEMDRGEGWVNALDVLRTGHYSLAVAVVRPSLVAAVGKAVSAPETVLVRRCVVPGREGLHELLSLVELVASAREP